MLQVIHQPHRKMKQNIEFTWTRVTQEEDLCDALKLKLPKQYSSTQRGHDFELDFNYVVSCANCRPVMIQMMMQLPKAYSPWMKPMIY